jgi:acrylyl-CoA reductase (NADPH)
MTEIPASYRAFVVEHEAAVPPAVRTLSTADLGSEGVLVRVEWSSLNFKDGLASKADGKVARRSPMTLGIDLAGPVLESADSRFTPGQAVLAHGYDIGVNHDGGLAELARIPGDWIVPLGGAAGPALSTRDAMILGTAGFTAGLSVHALEKHGVPPAAGPVLVTGATGGVGSAAVAILAARGYEVPASTGKADAADWLRSLGASEVLGRADIEAHAEKPLSKQVWAAAVDSVGGTTLAGALAATKYLGAVAASGLTGGAGLKTTVMPFILRGVALLGIDSVSCPMETRRTVWTELGAGSRPADLDALVGQELTLDSVQGGLDTILAGGARGRVLVRL